MQRSAEIPVTVSQTALPYRIPVTVIIPTRNEARHLARCLEGARLCAEIYVVDSQSTDETVEIARTFDAKVVQFHYGGGWPKKRQWALDSLSFENEWVLLLDADEILTTGPADVAGAGGRGNRSGRAGRVGRPPATCYTRTTTGRTGCLRASESSLPAAAEDGAGGVEATGRPDCEIGRRGRRTAPGASRRPPAIGGGARFGR